tara:strand:- start:5293 stop:5511 length:219 start_codon:yes stop_codon:yes gene_type:complete
MEIKPEDVRISVIKADHQTLQGNWGMQQPAGVAIFHIPTGIYAECGKHRSQHKNKAEALEELIKQIKGNTNE